MAKTKPLRMMALHGHFQSGPIFAKKTGALKKILSSLGVTHIHYPTAPYKLDEKNEDGGMLCLVMLTEALLLTFSSSIQKVRF